KVKYTGPAKDYSGYGEANRHDVGALVVAGVEVTTQIPVYCADVSDYGKLGDLAVSLENRELGYRIKIIHTTPNVYPQFYEPEKYLVGRAFWETDKLPLDFALPLQQVNEIWTGSKFNETAMRNAGVTKPVYIIPEAIDASVEPKEFEPYITAKDKEFAFYSIFEWMERKNPRALLEAYWREFENTKGVCLVLKTYQVGFGAEKREMINQNIRKLKSFLGLKNYAPVYLYRQLMDRHQIYRLHRTFDCFVSAHRGEGWGIPQMEAMLMEKPVISTNIGGIHEYLTHKKDAYLTKYKMVPVDNGNYNSQWYTPDQKWAEVDIDDLRTAMRWVFDHKAEAGKMGKAGRATVKAKFDLPVVGMQMRERLNEIQKEFTSV
ncbi:MAG: glycosyltransferase, partial [Candidatus Paceibacterota bacterium]